jgi:hypothetical protein
MTIKIRATQIAPNTAVAAPVTDYDLVNKLFVEDNNTTIINTVVTEVNSIGTILNNDSQPLIFGQPISIDSIGAKRASMVSFETARVIGLVGDPTIQIGLSGSIINKGTMVNQTVAWDQLILGNSGGLNPGSYYFLDPNNPGHMTTQVPTTQGQWLVRLGLALSATELIVSIQDPILL